jgi:hypothetical protein
MSENPAAWHSASRRAALLARRGVVLLALSLPSTGPQRLLKMIALRGSGRTQQSVEDATRAIDLNHNTLLKLLKLPVFVKEYRTARRADVPVE